jgi:branched-chain amino acid aminotransferase
MDGGRAFLNGRLVPVDEATVSISDAGFLHGASAFTTMRAHHGVVFRLGRHLSRLLETMDLLGLRTDATADGLARAAQTVLTANALTEARVRITLTSGSVGADRPTALITADPLPEYPPEWYEKGVSVVVSSFRQAGGDPTYGYKTGCYLPRVLARQEAAAKGAEEALWYTVDNRLAEACFCNVFLVRGGQVYTPPRDTPVLPGVVREVVREFCAQLGLKHHDDQALTVREMLRAEEMFLTSSCTGIRPVVRVERHAVADEKPGPVTRRLMSAYRDLLEHECSRGAGERSAE